MAAIKLSDREKNLMIVTVGALVFYVFYQFLLVPEWDSISRMRETAKEKRMEYKVAEGKIRILQAIEKQVGILPEKSQLPREEKALEVLRLISQATEKSNLKLIFIKPLLEESGEGLKFSFSCAGSYRELYNFLFILYRLRVLVMIDSLNAVSRSMQDPALEIKVELTAYY